MFLHQFKLLKFIMFWYHINEGSLKDYGYQNDPAAFLNDLR